MFPVEHVPQALERALRIALEYWSEAEIEDAVTAELLSPLPGGIDQLPDEVLVYKSAIARQQWKENGATPENANSMIHFLLDSSTITVVVDDPKDPLMQSIINDIREYVYQDIFWMQAA